MALSRTLANFGDSLGSNALVIDSSGNVGIGTASPLARLHVQGNGIVAGVNNTAGNFMIGTTSVAAGYANANRSTITLNSSALNIGSYIFLQDNGSTYGYIGAAFSYGFAVTGLQSSGLTLQCDAQNAPMLFKTNSTGGGAAEKMRIDASGNVGIGTSSPVSKLSIYGNYSISATAASSGTINCSSGNYFTRTITGTETITFANVPTTGNAYSFTLVLTNGGSAAVTWGSTPKWPSGTAPTLTSSGVDILVFFTSDGGTTWRGNLVQKDSK